MTKYHRLSDLNNRNRFSHGSEAGSLRTGHQHGWFPGFPGSSAGKESTFNAGDPGLIPGLGRSPGGGIDYPLQCSWIPPVTQMVKTLPALWETWVRSLGWEDPLEKGMVTHSNILA